MLKILTSLSFLYALVIAVLILYGFIYLRNFKRSRTVSKLFPLVFLIIGVACGLFLWINFHAPLSLKTYSNLDHHFLQHDGFTVAKKIELGRSDTANLDNTSFNRFLFARQNGVVTVNSGYSEDPLYIQGEKGYRILSVNYPAVGHAISFQCDKVNVRIHALEENWFELKTGEEIFKKQMPVKKGVSGWNIFKDDDAYINSVYYNNEKIAACLKNILFLRDDVSRKEGGDLKYFISGRLFSYASLIKYDDQKLDLKTQLFVANLPDQSTIAWGIGFLDNNRNQYRLKYAGKDSFSLLHRFPVAYPLAEENRDDWSPHYVSKFLLSDPEDLHRIPAVFKEGFMFSSYDGDRLDFAPLLLTYKKGERNSPLQVKLQTPDNKTGFREFTNNQLFLPAASADFNWAFSLHNTFDWDFGNYIITAKNWKLLLFGSLGIFFLLVFFTSFSSSTGSQRWVWQLLSAVTLVLLTTRFFLYWRYKSFPPYEGMDLPSQQQLQSFWNFGILVVTTIVLAVVFGFGSIKRTYTATRMFIGRLMNKPFVPGNKHAEIFSGVMLGKFAKKFPLSRQLSSRLVFFAAWSMLLIVSGIIAAVNRFDPGVCRHLAIGLIAGYFVFLFVSYKYSPLVSEARNSWWEIGTGNFFNIIVSNPVKIILSVSLLALFVFIDIGFAIVFLNFLFFNEAFLCINYGVAGLSAGSKKNAASFGFLGLAYLVFFVLNLFYAPWVFKFLLNMPQAMYLLAYAGFALVMTYMIVRLFPQFDRRKKNAIGFAMAAGLFLVTFFFFPKERIIDKAAMTRYRIDVLTEPVERAITSAYEEGKTYEPVIRAAQNQWFINTFIHEENNPRVQALGFELLPHAPQNKGAKYNAQATDLVTSRFLIAEHGKWSVLLYVLLLLLPGITLASFYKLYPDFTNRTNAHYPTITAGFSILNYLVITALLVILAATGRYIFFGQDLPFGSILSKQSILFPCLLIVAVVVLFKSIPQEHYANRKKFLPGAVAFLLLGALLFLFKPAFNKNREFAAGNLATEMDTYIQMHLQPVLDQLDTSSATRRLSAAKKDELFSDSLRKMIASGVMSGGNKFFISEINAYARSGFTRHLDQRRMLYLDLYSGSPRLAVNENFFRVDPPPHLQQLWTGNVFGDTSVFNVTIWNAEKGSVIQQRIQTSDDVPLLINNRFQLSTSKTGNGPESLNELFLFNKSGSALHLKDGKDAILVEPGAKLKLNNPCRILMTDSLTMNELVLTVEPDAFMKNYYVNGNRFYVYPMKSDFVWARNFAEAISSDYTAEEDKKRNAFVSFDFGLMNALSEKIRSMMKDTAYKKGAEYGICIADGNGRIVAMNDFIKGFDRPDPNDKTAFNKVIIGENGFVSQSLLRKKIGNLNLLRMNPGPGSTFKPIVFSAIASQLNWEWEDFAAEGFSEKQTYYGGEKVPEYDFEKDNGRISTVSDYLKFSDNYYHSNVLLLGSYPKQSPAAMLDNHFVEKKPGSGLHWPYFTYTGKQYWLNGFQNWPGYSNGKANFGMDSSFTTVGLLNNYGIYTHTASKSFVPFHSPYDSLLFKDANRKSGFILPEYPVFDQRGDQVDHRVPYDVFTSCFRGHVKGSSQVMVPPVKMLEAFGKLISQSRNYQLTLNPYAIERPFLSFEVDNNIPYIKYLSIIRENVFAGMKAALFSGTAARLGSLLKDGAPYYYYAKTGTTGDDDIKTKSKLLAVIISSRDVTEPGFNFRNNKFFTVYFTSQNGPAKQNEEFQADVINYIQQTVAFNRYMQ